MRSLFILGLLRVRSLYNTFNKTSTYHSTQFSKLKPSTLNKSLSLETTIKPLTIAVVAIKIF